MLSAAQNIANTALVRSREMSAAAQSYADTLCIDYSKQYVDTYNTDVNMIAPLLHTQT